MSKAVGTLVHHESTGRYILALKINGHHYGDYPLDQGQAEDQLEMAKTDAKDYGCPCIEIVLGSTL